MNTSTLGARVKQLEESPATASLQHLEAIFAVFDKDIASVFFNLLDVPKGGLPDELELIRMRLKPWRDFLTQVPPSQMFRLLFEVERSSSNVLNPDVVSDQDAGAQQLHSPVQFLQSRYEAFIREPGLRSAAEVGVAGCLLLNQLHTQRQLARSLLVTPVSEPLPRAGYDQIDLYFPFVSELRATADKLTALEDLYTEIAMVLGVSTAEWPLRLVRVESGSLWVRLVGESRIVTLLIKLIDSSISYLYRQYTIEGKITTVGRRTDVVVAILRMAEELRKNGIESTELNEEIEKAAVAVAKGLNRLLTGEAAVVVNGVRYGVDEATSEKALRDRSHLKLLTSSNVGE